MGLCSAKVKGLGREAAWVSERFSIPGLDQLSDDACYRAMDWLIELEAELAEQVYWSTATLLNLEVDLLFFDTTSTYFETDEADPPSEGAPRGSARSATARTTGRTCPRSCSASR